MVIRVHLLSFVLLLEGCALVAGLDDFQPASGGAGGSSDSGGASNGGEGGVGGAGQGGEGIGGEPPMGGAGGESPCADDLVISEVRTFGSNQGTDDFVEIYNPTEAAISLDGVAIVGKTPTGVNLTDRWRGTVGDQIAADSYFVVGGAGFDDTTPDRDFMGSSLGDDTVLALQRGPLLNAVTLDFVCLCTENCDGPDWAACDGLVLVNPAGTNSRDLDESLQRVPDCMDTDQPSDFVIRASTPKAPNGR